MESLRLRTGRTVTIRSIRADDGPALTAAYARLSPQSRHQRFLVSKPYLSLADTRYLVDVDGLNHVALVATPFEASHEIIAVGRFVRLAEDPSAAEFAIVVGDPFQGEGLATELLDRLADRAVERGITRFTATMFADNLPAHRLIQRLAGRLPSGRRLGAVDEFEFELAS